MQNAKRDKFKVTNDYLIMKLTEEVGELAQSYLVHNKKCRPIKIVSKKESKKQIAKELADVFCLSLIVASSLNIDIEEAITNKWITGEWLKQA